MGTPVDAEHLENESRTRAKVCVFIALMISSDKKLAVDDLNSRFEGI
jgi:hypothetical protein